MTEKNQYTPNVSLGGEIVKEKGRKSPAGELGNDDGVNAGNNKSKKNR